MKRQTFAYYKSLYQTLDLYEEQKGKIYRYLISAATDGILLSPPELPLFLKDIGSAKEKKKAIKKRL